MLVFNDDILVYTKDEKDHDVYVRLVSNKLRQHKFKAKFLKCSFWKHEVKFLEHVVSENGLAINPLNIETNDGWKRPELVIKMRSFFGLAGYYCRFIKDFLHIAASLTKLTRKNKKFVWINKYEISF